MIDAYRIGIRLQLKTEGVTSGLRMLQNRFRDLEKTAQGVQNAFTGGQAALVGYNREALRSARVLSSLRKIAENTGAHQTMVIGQVANTRTRANNQAEMQARRMERDEARRQQNAQRAAEYEQRRNERAAAMEARRQERQAAMVARHAQQAERAKQRSAERAARANEIAARRAQQAWDRSFRRTMAGAASSGSSMRQAMGGAVGGSLTAYGMGRFANQSVNSAISMERERLIAGRGINFDSGSRTEREAAARAISSSRSDISTISAMGMINDMSNTLGQRNAIATAPMVADFMTLMRGMRQDGLAVPNEETAFRDIAAILETRGVIYDRQGNFTPERVRQELVGILEYIRLNPSANSLNQLRHMTNHAGPAVSQMSTQQFIATAASVIPNVGGRPAGTLIESFVGGVMRGSFSRNYADALVRTGALTRDDLFRTDGGGYRLRDDANGRRRELRQLTYQFRNDETGQMETRIADPLSNPAGYQIAMAQALSRREGITEEAAITRLFPTSATRKGANQVLQNLIQMERNARELERTISNANLALAAQRLRQEQLSTAVNTVRAQFSNLNVTLTDIFHQDMVSGLHGFADIIRQINTYAAEDPEKFRSIVSEVGAVFAVGGAATAIGLGMSMLSRVFLPFAVGMAAYEAMTALTGERGLPAIAAAFSMLAPAVTSFFNSLPQAVQANAGAIGSRMLLGAMVGGKTAGPIGAVAGAVIGAGTVATEAIGGYLGQRRADEVTTPEALQEAYRRGGANILAYQNSPMGSEEIEEYRREVVGPAVQRARRRAEDERILSMNASTDGPAAGSMITSGLDRPISPEAANGLGNGRVIPSQNRPAPSNSRPTPPTPNAPANPNAASGASPPQPGAPGATNPAAAAGRSNNVPVAPPPPQRVININFNSNIDGRQVATEVMRIIGDQVSMPNRGYGGFDGRAAPVMPGTPTPGAN